MYNYLNQGNDRFLSYYYDDIFVDKSLLIKETNNFIGKASRKYISISRPSKFGKTVCLSMLNAYYSKGCDSKELFSSLEISNETSFEMHLNKHNVILLDIPFIYNKESEYSFISALQRSVIEEIKEQYSSISFENDNTLPDVLLKVYKHTNEKFIFLVDDYDYVFRKSTNKLIENEYSKLLINLFNESTLSICIDLVVMMGILPIKKDLVENGLTFNEYTVINSKNIAKYLGFTDDEVDELCKKYKMKNSLLKCYYGAYNIDGIKIYNPKSVIESIKNQSLVDYWILTINLEKYIDYLKRNNNRINETALGLFALNRVKVSLKHFVSEFDFKMNVDEFLTLLIHMGILTYYNDERTCAFPNSEISNYFIGYIPYVFRFK